MPRKYKKKTAGVSQTINITVNTERKRKPRKKRASKSKSKRGIGPSYTGPSTIYGEPLPLPPRVIEVNAPYLLQPGSTLATGQIPVPLLMNAPQREMLMDAPRRESAPAILDDTRSQASTQRSYMRPSFKENLTETVREENASLASMAEPLEEDPLDYAVSKMEEEKKSKGLFSSFFSGASEYAVPAAVEVGSNALIAAAAAAGQGAGIPAFATLAAGNIVKETVKGRSSRKKQVRIAKEAVDEALRAEKGEPFKVDTTTISIFEKYFKDADATKLVLNRIKKKYPDATQSDLDQYFEEGVPFSR